MFTVRDDQDALHVVFESIKEANEYDVTPYPRDKWYQNNLQIGDWIECDDGGVVQILKVSQTYYFIPRQKVNRHYLGRIIWSLQRIVPEFKMPNELKSLDDIDGLTLQELAHTMGILKKQDISKLTEMFENKLLASVWMGLDPESKSFRTCFPIAALLAGRIDLIPQITTYNPNDSKPTIKNTNTLSVEGFHDEQSVPAETET